MAHQKNHGFCSPAILRLVLVFVGVCLVGYVMGTQLYWRFTESVATQAPCSCSCDCSSESTLSMIPLGLENSSLEDCGKHDPDASEEMEKAATDLLAEELRLRGNVAEDNKQHAQASILEAKKTSSQYQKEAEKCNSGMETCEEAREKAEAALGDELKLLALWEKRAREHGWTESGAAAS